MCILFMHYSPETLVNLVKNNRHEGNNYFLSNKSRYSRRYLPSSSFLEELCLKKI